MFDLLWNALWVDDLLEHVDQVVELSVDVTDDDDRLLHLQQVGFLLYASITCKDKI